jgi:hypothetical protein
MICETDRPWMAQRCGHRAHLSYQQSAHAGLVEQSACSERIVMDKNVD